MTTSNNAKAKFDALKHARPDMVEGHISYGAGYSGIAICFENSVRKVLYHEPERRDFALSQLEREVTLLRHFQNSELPQIVPVPVLLSEPQKMDGDYLATYTMSRISGRDLYAFMKEEHSPEILSEQLQSIGRYIALFHAAAANLDLGEALPQGPFDTSRILQVPEYDEVSNRRLDLANQYLQARKIEGNAHGDLNPGNIILDETGFKGLIDFSHGGYTQNIFADLALMDGNILPDILAGYEEQSGHSDLRYVIAATNLALWTAIKNDNMYLDADHSYKSMADDKIQKTLQELSPALDTIF